MNEIGGSAAYRVSPDFHLGSLPLSGAIGPALHRLRRETASLRAISRWPGMNIDRAVRMLNGLYLLSGLMVLRMHPAARKEPTTHASGWLSWIKKSR